MLAIDSLLVYSRTNFPCTAPLAVYCRPLTSALLILPRSTVPTHSLASLVPLVPLARSRAHTVEVVAHNVGFRPSRDTGARLDIEEFLIGDPSSKVRYSPRSTFHEPVKVSVVHAYGVSCLQLPRYSRKRADVDEMG